MNSAPRSNHAGSVTTTSTIVRIACSLHLVSPNSWLAVDDGTTPKVRAQELRFAWERFLADDDEEDRSSSARRSPTRGGARSAAGVDPTGGRKAPVVADEAETHERFEEHPLAAAAPLIHECLSAIADEAGYLIVVSDADGMLMTIEGTASVRLRAAADMNFAEGTLWSEGGAGTNAIGTAIALDHAVQVFGPEHFSDPVQRWTCSAAPDPRPGHRRGDRRDRPHGRPAHRAPAQPRRRHRHRARRRGQPPARAAGARRAPARPLRRPRRAGPQRADHAVRPRDRRRPARLERRRPARDPARRRRAHAPVRRRPRSPSRSPPRSRRSSCTPSSPSA